MCIAQTPTSGTSSDAGGANAIPEILITAQKRVESLENVPVSVSALDSETLAKARIENPADIAGITPNLQMQNTVGDEIPIFSLRGVSMSDFSLNQASPVATYFDEVYKGNFALLGVGMFDLERIEVLRGPQGTLYGKNTTGGAINLVTRKPGFDTEGYLSAGYGNYNRKEADAAFQTGLGKFFAIRIAATFAQADGWFRNELPGHPDMNATRHFGVRVSLLFKPTDSLDFVLRTSTGMEDPTNYGIYSQVYPQFGCIGGGVYTAFHNLYPASNPNVDDCRVGLGRRQIKSEYTPDRENRTYSVALTTTWRFQEHLTLTAVSAWDKATLLVPEDSDGSYLAVIEEPYNDRVHQLAQDLRITSDFAGPVNFIAGLYWNHEDVYNATAFRLYTDLDVNGDGVLNSADCVAGIPLGLLGCVVQNSFDQIKDSKAAYTDVTFETTKQIKLRAGVRYTHDTGEQKNFTSDILGRDGTFIANSIPGPPPVTGLGPGCSSGPEGTGCSYSQGQTTGKLGIDFTTQGGGLIYASASRGYRPSGFNAQAFFAPGELSVAKPETLDAVELGSKFRSFGNRLQVNSAIFYYRYNNQQILSTDPITAEQRLINLTRSRIVGGELEIVARPVSALTLTGGLGLLNTRVEEGSVSGTSVVGTHLANAPTASVSAAADWTFLSNDRMNATLRLDGTYATRQYFDPLNHLYQPSYGLVNARLALRSADSRWGIAFWGKNLFDAFYLTSRIDVPGFGFIYNHEGAPTTFGVTVDYQY
jgi:iron complex outermembrane receptor protein